MEKKKTHSIKSYFLTGILVSAPLAITVYLALELIKFIDTKVNAMIPVEYNPMTHLPYSIPGFGIAILFGFLSQVFMFVNLISSPSSSL